MGNLFTSDLFILKMKPTEPSQQQEFKEFQDQKINENFL